MSVDFLVDVGGQKVCIINNHLQSYSISEKEREDFHHILQGDVEADTARIETLQLIEKLSKGTTRRAAQVRMVAARIQQRLKEGAARHRVRRLQRHPPSPTHTGPCRRD